MDKLSLAIILGQFKEAHSQMGVALLQPADRNDVIRDGTIQRFEFTFEICWKTLKRFLELQGLQPKTPKDTFQEAFRLGWLSEGDTFWFEMMKDRNLTNHTYSKPLAEQIYKHLGDYHKAFSRLIGFLQSQLDQP